MEPRGVETPRLSRVPSATHEDHSCRPSRRRPAAQESRTTAIAERTGRAVPSGRLSRLARFGGLGARVAGGVLAEGARRAAKGQRPRLGDLLLTPANARRVTDQLSTLRGAAMKLGQLVSMDAGDVLPVELSDILGQLRSDARPMPRAQLLAQLEGAWGVEWRARVPRFDMAPIAAASIGQVHRARTADGRDLAVKVQYPGVARSIDSDVDNVATLLRVSGLVPRALDIQPMLAEAKRELHEEADYAREAAMLTAYRERLAGDDRFLVPAAHPDLSGGAVLAMDHAAGAPLDALVTAPRDERDRVAGALIELVARELWEWGWMQTDPNLANTLVRRDTGTIVLLDFGATQPVGAETQALYRAGARAILAHDRAGVERAMEAMGLFDMATTPGHRAAVLEIADIAMAELHAEPLFDFADGSLVRRLREKGMAVAQDRDAWRLPPSETLFVQRKISGTALMANRLKARVDVLGVLRRFVGDD